MKPIYVRTIALAGLSVSLLAFFACDSKHTLIEAFLQNGAETKLFTYTLHNYGLGQSVAIGGDIALVGASFGFPTAAYLYRLDVATWSKEANLSHNGYSIDGYSVALSGIRAVVGGKGSASVYRLYGSEWKQEAELSPGGGATNNEFGKAVSMSESVIAVGVNSGSWNSAFGDNYFPDAGLVYIYRFNGSSWVEQAQLTGGAEAYGFGATVSISGDVAIVGAWGADAKHEDAGMAYVYRFTGSSWQEEAQLTANDAATGDRFGRAVAVSGDVAIIGAPYNDENIANAGSAYIFRYNGSSWRQEAKLSFTGTTPSTGAYFGSAVAVEQNVAIIGAPFYNYDRYIEDDRSGSTPGVAYMYRWDGAVWREQKVLTASDGTPDNRFGAAVSISGRLAIVGAPNLRYSNNAGAAYVYVLN
jgi:hypothetical protein